jgi:type II restriction enzyme
MADRASVQRRGNIGDHGEFLAFATVIADGYLELTDPTGEIQKGRLDVMEVSREAIGQREKSGAKKTGALVRRAYYISGEYVMIRSDADGVCRRLCPKIEVSDLVGKLRNELICWSQNRGKRETAEGDPDGAVLDHYSESANRLMELFEVGGLKAPSSSKSDLYLTFKQPNGIKVTQGFSVKSLMGSNSCLINHSGATLVTFEVINCSPERALELESNYCREEAERTSIGNLKPRSPKKPGPSTIIPALARDKDVQVKFAFIPDATFRGNLIGIDTSLPAMVAHVLYQRYLSGENSPREIVKLPASVEMMTQMGHPKADASKTLERKIKDLFQRYAQGMNTTEPWDDQTEVKGGWVLVIKDGRVTGYCFEDDDGFRKYLFDSTYFDTPDVKRVPAVKKKIAAYVGRPYSVDQKTFIDLSLMVKFSKSSVSFSDVV